MAICAYRSLEPVLEERLAALRERCAVDGPAAKAACRVASRRIGRAAGGGAATAVAACAMLVGLGSMLDQPWAHQRRDDFWATALLLAAWPAGVAVALAGRAIAARALRARVHAPAVLTGDVAADLAAIDASDPLLRSRAIASRWERASVALPMAAVSLLAPLTIHWIVWSSLSGPAPIAARMTDFGGWIAMSVLIVGHAHLAVLVGSVRWAMRLRGRTTADVGASLAWSWGSTLVAAVAVACLPGIALLAIPPVLVSVTGLLFIPAMFVVAARAVRSERMALTTGPIAL